jgi:hypothetical protein
MISRTYGGDVPPCVRCKNGTYRIFRDTDIIRQIEAPKPLAHSIQVKCSLPVNRGWGASGAASRIWGSVSARPLWHLDESNGQFMRREIWRERPVVVQVTASTGTILASLESSSKAVDPREFGEWVEWLETWLGAQGLAWTDEASSLVNIEFNQDYRELALKELRGMRLRKWRNAWLQAYQKGEFLRFEVRWSPGDDDEITLMEAAAVLRTLQAPARERERVIPPPHDWEVV